MDILSLLKHEQALKQFKRQARLLNVPLRLPTDNEDINRIVEIFQILSRIYNKIEIHDFDKIYTCQIKGRVYQFSMGEFYNLLFLCNFTLDILEHYHQKDRTFIVKFKKEIEMKYSQLLVQV